MNSLRGLKVGVAERGNLEMSVSSANYFNILL